MKLNTNYWQGKLVRLRGLEPADAEHLIRWNRDSEMGERMDFVWPPVSDASERARVAQDALRHALKDDAFDWVIADLDGEPVGTIDTHNCKPHWGTFGYAVYVAPEHRCRGYAREAIQIVLRYYFHELRYQKVNIKVYANNSPSLTLHEKLGFVREGTLRRSLFQHGEYVDVALYGMTREEFEALYS
jgi:RimJ/RimL family protein N-acetyltransferase